MTNVFNNAFPRLTTTTPSTSQNKKVIPSKKKDFVSIKEYNLKANGDSPSFVFGDVSAAIQTTDNLGVVTIYASLDGLTFSQLEDANGDPITMTITDTTIRLLPDTIFGIPHIKLVPQNDGQVIISIY